MTMGTFLVIMLVVAVASFVAGALVGRRNRKKLETGVAYGKDYLNKLNKKG